MIKVNLVGASRKKTRKAGAGLTMPATVTPILLAVIFLGPIVYGYTWYSDINGQNVKLAADIATALAQKAKLDEAIKQDAAVEARKKAIENRVKIIDGLKRNQVSPVMPLDLLSEAVDKTQYVWLSNLDQSNAVLSMSGTGTSVNAIADFVTNLQATGYFKNVDVANAQDSAGNFTFSLRCEFVPMRPTPAQATARSGGN